MNSGCSTGAARKAMERLAQLISQPDLGRLARACYQCTVCTGGCPVGQWDADFNPRRVIELIVRQELAAVLSDGKIWLCATCHTCLERCPQKIEVSEIMVQLKNAAASAGIVPERQIKAVQEVMKTGWLHSPGKRILRTRQELGLPEIPEGITVSELRQLITCSNLDKIAALKAHSDQLPESVADRLASTARDQVGD